MKSKTRHGLCRHRSYSPLRDQVIFEIIISSVKLHYVTYYKEEISLKGSIAKPSVKSGQ